MKVDFYFDPGCPWCWVTSRWLDDVASQRDLNVSWKPFSLAMKNGTLSKAPEKHSDYDKSHLSGHRVLRVIEAAAQTDAERGKLYSDIGQMHHVDGYPYSDIEIELMLSLNRLDPELLQAADDKKLDENLQQSLDEAISIVGEDVGVPLIIFEKPDGNKLGYFGPVLMKQPTGQTALDLWDGLSKLATAEDFYELKRSRPSGGPQIGKSTTPPVC